MKRIAFKNRTIARVVDRVHPRQIVWRSDADVIPFVPLDEVVTTKISRCTCRLEPSLTIGVVNLVVDEFYVMGIADRIGTVKIDALICPSELQPTNFYIT